MLADPDGDGADNWGEYIADTNPTSPLEVFLIQSVTPVPGACQAVLRSRPGRFYGLETRSSLTPGTPWEVVADNLPGTGDLLLITIEGDASPRLLRATVRLPE